MLLKFLKIRMAPFTNQSQGSVHILDKKLISALPVRERC